MLDPQARALIDLMVERQVPPTHTLPVAEAGRFHRDRHAFTQPDPPPVGEVRDLQAEGPHGAIPLRLYRPAGTAAAPLPMLVYFHGGGWVIGDLDTHDVVSRTLCAGSGCSDRSGGDVACRVGAASPSRGQPRDQGLGSRPGIET